MQIQTVTGRVYVLLLEILSEHPEGVRWNELLRIVQERDHTLHPKTVNGCIWKLLEKYPDMVCKPSKGVFKRI